MLQSKRRGCVCLVILLDKTLTLRPRLVSFELSSQALGLHESAPAPGTFYDVFLLW